MNKTRIYNIAAFSLIVVSMLANGPLTTAARSGKISGKAARHIPGVIVIVAIAVWLRGIKVGLLGNCPEQREFIKVSADDYTWCDRARLDYLTSELDQLGFTFICDYTVPSKGAAQMVGFARLMASTKYQCFAEINQMATQTMYMPMEYMLGSQLSGDWSISSITRKPSGGNWIIRKPRSLWTYHPGVNPADMLNIHLQNRADMARDLSEQVTFNGTFEGWVELENASAKLTRAIVKRRNVIAILFEFFTFGSHPRSEWWGEYGRKRNR